MCCKWRESWADGQRRTWIKDIPKEIDYKYFFGNDLTREPKYDEVFVNCSDDYRSLPAKVYHALKWALDNGYDYIMKTDDDVYIRPERLLTSGFENHDYVGRIYTTYACGLAYWLSAKAAKFVVDAGEPPLGLEDVWVGKIMQNAGIQVKHDERFCLAIRSGSRISNKAIPEFNNDIILSGEFTGNGMNEPHDLWKASVNEYNNFYDLVKI